MPLLYRVFPLDLEAGAHEPGGALFVPHQGGGRLDNPRLYSVLYLSDAPAGAIAEAFGRFPEWRAAMLQGPSALPGSVRALARYSLPDDTPLCDLDDSAQLQQLSLRPSDVVSRDYNRSREWARRIYERHSWIGVRWWSYYDPSWYSIGLWDIERLTLEDVQPLRLDDDAVSEASATIKRRIVDRPRR